MFLRLIVGALLVQAITASPYIADKHTAQVLNYEVDTTDLPNSYRFHYDASDGSSRSEEGSILNRGTDDATLDVYGSVRWYDNKGQLYEMTYKAGRLGYRTIIKKVKN